MSSGRSGKRYTRCKMTIRQKITKKSDAITFGKYKGVMVSHILKAEPSYILWLNSENIVMFTDAIIQEAEENNYDEERDKTWWSWGWDGSVDD